MNDIVVGINESRLSELALEITDYNDRISEIFDNIDSLMRKLPNSYQGKPCTDLMNYYTSLASSYGPIKQNIKSYSDDLISLIRKLKENDARLAVLFDDLTAETQAKTKLINS